MEHADTGRIIAAHVDVQVSDDVAVVPVSLHAGTLPVDDADIASRRQDRLRRVDGFYVSGNADIASLRQDRLRRVDGFYVSANADIASWRQGQDHRHRRVDGFYVSGNALATPFNF